jgi:hypothetical protein
MKDYPKIFGSYEKPTWGEHCIAFNKIDGSNLRFEWNAKRGWYKYGTRRRMFDHTDPEYGVAVDIFRNKYAQAVDKVLRDKYPKVTDAMAFAEFFGPYSFGGKHEEEWLLAKGLLPADRTNTPKDLILFDVNLFKRGFLDPETFIKHFSHVHIPEVVYQGRLTEEFAQDVRQGKYPVTEGVVAKGGAGHHLWMRKIKTYDYLKKVRKVFGTGWLDHWA